METLAIHGGRPVRITPFPTCMIGASQIGEEELAELSDVVREKSPFRHYGIGHPQKVNTLERQFAQKFGAKYALAVSSGSAALMCAIAALGLGPGDEVIVPCFSWYSDYCSLVTMGVVPVFAEIGEDLNLDPSDIQCHLTKRTKAIIVVHFQGCPAQMDEILTIAKAYHLYVIEDSAQACGGQYNGKALGTMGDVGIYSFQTHKILTAGEGGMIVTNREDFYLRAVRFHDLGFVRNTFLPYLERPEEAEEEKSFAGMQFRMNELSGAFLLAQLNRLDGMLEKCRGYQQQLIRYAKDWKKIKVRYQTGDCGIAFMMLFKKKEEREFFCEAMAAEGIPFQVASACCNLLHKAPITSRNMVHPALPPFGLGYAGEQVVYGEADCPQSDDILSRCASMGIGPSYTQQDIEDIITAMGKIYPYLDKGDL